MPTTSPPSTVFLEVVRGRDAGRRYALAGRSIVLGNAVAAGQGIDLADQEGSAPRKMAARQASIESSKTGFLLRDLDSPGGTFVNRQRILAGQAKTLALGDVIQLGGVQLKLVNGEATVSKPPQPLPTPATAPFLITLQSGTTCRSWDDLLVVSAQRWVELRDELVTGRLAGSLTAIGQSELAPDPMAKGSPDERLDAWLGRLPTTKPAEPELDVHPKRLVLKAIPGGGKLFAKVRLDNTGYRLLRFSVHVEPTSTDWLAPSREFARVETATAEGLDVSLEITIPETLSSPRTASLVITSNGGTRSIAVVLEPAASPASIFPTTSARSTSPSSFELTRFLSRFSRPSRLVAGAILGALCRSILAVASAVAGIFGIGVVGESPSLAGSGLAMASLGLVVGGLLAIRKKAWSDLVYASFAGSIGGLLVAAVLVAATRSVESLSQGISAAPIMAKILLWALIGLAVAGISTIVIPPKLDPGRAR